MFRRSSRRGSSLLFGNSRYSGAEPMSPSPLKCAPTAHLGWCGRDGSGVTVDAPQVNRLGFGHLAGAIEGLTGDAVRKADLHVQRDALQLHRVEVADKTVGGGRAEQCVLPQGHAHRGAVGGAPTQKSRACAVAWWASCTVSRLKGYARACDKTRRNARAITSSRSAVHWLAQVASSPLPLKGCKRPFR